MLITPECCLRNIEDCQPLSQIVSDDEGSFICMGRLDPSARALDQDCFRLCWKNDEVDEMGDWDARDLIDTVSVMAQGLSIEANRSVNAPGQKHGHLFSEPSSEGADYQELTTQQNGGHFPGQKHGQP